MAGRSINFFPYLIIFIILFLIDLYVYKGLKMLLSGMANEGVRKGILIAHWVIFAVIIGWMFTAIVTIPWNTDYKNYKYYYYLFGIILLFYLPKLVFSIFIFSDDLIFALRKIAHFFMAAPAPSTATGENVTRLQFLYTIGAGIAAIPFAGAAYGMIKGRFDYRVKNVKIALPNLPASFNGLRLVQISDLHLGSFFDEKEEVQKALKMINNLNADVLVVTGDWVNNYAAEAENWIPDFKNLTANIAKLGIMGNHDYGDYSAWNSPQEKARNFERLQEIQQEMGFKTLLNSHHIIQKGTDKIAIIGVENWGVKPFPQHGDLSSAKKGTENIEVKILLSHDPSHFEEVVTKGHPDIDLTLSGHTHGAQFGVELGNIKWSPVKYKYPRWAGLYEVAHQKLYVNRGFGYLGFPGRVGMPPEITVFEFSKA